MLAALNAWWYWSHRRGFPLFVDESGYTSFALDHTHALREDGLRGLFDSYQSNSVQAPLVPLLTVPAQLVVGEHIGTGFVVILGFYVLLVLATYAVARRLVPPWPAALAALLVATAPGVLTFTRMYYFAIPVAALFTAAIWCFLRSDGLARPGWALAGGALLGLTVLSRTLALALAPGVLLAAAVQAIAREQPRSRRLLNLLGATLVASAVAATWYVRNFANVYDYLTGTQFRGPGGEPGFAPGRWLHELGAIVRTVYLPLALVLAGALVAALAVAMTRQRARSPAMPVSARRVALPPLASDAVFLTVILLQIAAVAAVADFAGGQWIMVLPLLVTFAVAALGSLPRRDARVALSATLAAIAMFNLVQLTDVSSTLGQPRGLNAGPFGRLTVTDGRQFLQQDLGSIGDEGRPGRLPESLRRLLPLYRELTEWILAYAAERQERPVVFTVGKESKLLKPNDLLLADRLLEKHGVLLVGQLFLDQNASARAYREQLDDPRFGLPNFVITGPDPAFLRNHSTEELSPAEQKVDALGFHVMRTAQLPDGLVRIWWRSQADVPASRAA